MREEFYYQKKVIKIKMELKLENVCPCTAALFHAQP